MRIRMKSLIARALPVALVIVISACGANREHAEPTVDRHLPTTTAAAPMADSAAGAIPEDANSVSLKDSYAGSERYNRIVENEFVKAESEPLSTFSIDVDAAAYSNVRRYITTGSLPPADAVRIEELINYFTYDYPQPTTADPFSITTDVANCPWNDDHQLVLIGLQGKKMAMGELPPSNLVFLIDVSGSMGEPNKLPLVQKSLDLLVDQLREQDHVAIVVYAGAAGLVLPSTSGADKTTIRNAIDNLESGGSTAGGDGIVLAYKVAARNFIPNGNNRVILATDGDFNVGVSDEAGLVRLIEEKRKQGVFLSVIGVGTGNLQDGTMEQLADKGNGHYAYFDDETEAKKVFVNEIGATLFAIAKDVKLQVEFNPELVASYRLIGYENRMLATKDFDDDTKDAGELGAGHSVTALYEIVPRGGQTGRARVQPLLNMKGTRDGFAPVSFSPRQVMAVKLRYKKPEEETSRLIVGPAIAEDRGIDQASGNIRFAAAVAEWGMLLRGSRHKGTASYDDVLRLARSARGADPEGYRNDFLALVDASRNLAQPAH